MQEETAPLAHLSIVLRRLANRSDDPMYKQDMLDWADHLPKVDIELQKMREEILLLNSINQQLEIERDTHLMNLQTTRSSYKRLHRRAQKAEGEALRLRKMLGKPDKERRQAIADSERYMKAVGSTQKGV